MVACHAVDPGSSPGQCKSFCFSFLFGDCLFVKRKEKKSKEWKIGNWCQSKKQEKTHLVFLCFFFPFCFCFTIVFLLFSLTFFVPLFLACFLVFCLSSPPPIPCVSAQMTESFPSHDTHSSESDDFVELSLHSDDSDDDFDFGFSLSDDDELDDDDSCPEDDDGDEDEDEEDDDEEGEECEGEFEAAIEAANEGDGEAMNRVGQCFAKGQGVHQNRRKAFEWFMKAAENGNSHAMHCVGWCFEKGLGVARDVDLAFDWYFKQQTMGVWVPWSKSVSVFCLVMALHSTMKGLLTGA